MCNIYNVVITNTHTNLSKNIDISSMSLHRVIKMFDFYVNHRVYEIKFK
jgi:hypothetical protein